MTSDENWTPCPPGTIDAVVSEHQRVKRREQSTRRVMLSLVVVAGVGMVSAMLPGRKSQSAIACGEVPKLAKQYLLGQMPPDQSAAFDAHLKRCPPCADYVERLRKTAAV